MQRPKIPFTKEGYQKIKQDFAKYTEKRKEAVISLRTAREMGDLSENGAYKAARFELSDIDRQLRRLSYQLRFGTVIETKHGDYIDFGRKVTLTDGNKKLTFFLVGGFESNPSEQKLSIHSPIGKAVLRKRIGEVVTVDTPSGQKKYTILHFE